MEYLRTILSKNLGDLRRSKGLTQKQVAEAIGVNQSSYGRWENGEWIGSESLGKIEDLAQFYGVLSTRFFFDPDVDKKETTNTWANRQSPKEIKKALQAVIDLLDK